MQNIILFLQISVSLALIILIILQAKGVGLGHAWGGAGEFYKSRRGVEKLIFNVTIALVIAFLITSILSLVYS